MAISKDVQIYGAPKRQSERLEFTQKGSDRLQESNGEEATARSFFTRLQEKGIIPKSAEFDKVIKGSDPPITYKQVMTAALAKTLGNTDSDTLTDLDTEAFFTQLVDSGVIDPEKNSLQKVIDTLVSKKTVPALKYSPPELTYFCNEQETDRASRPRAQTGTANNTAASSSGGIKGPGSQTRFEDRFTVNPYKMSEVVGYFKSFAQTHTPAEFRAELQLYLQTYYVHAEESPLAGSNVTEQLGIGRSSDLTKYFTLYQDRAVADCNIFAEVANTIIRGSGLKGASTEFVSMKYFGEETGHVVLLIKVANQRWLLSNDNITTPTDLSDNNLALLFSHEGQHISALGHGQTFASAIAVQLSPEKGLFSKDVNIRQNAIEYLSDHPDQKSLPLLVKAATTDPDPAVRLHASYILRGYFVLQKLEDQTSLALLSSNLPKEKDPAVRQVMLDILHNKGKIDQPSYVKELGQLLDQLGATGEDRFLAHYNSQTGHWLGAEIIEGLITEGKPGTQLLADRFDSYPVFLQESILNYIGYMRPPTSEALHLLETTMDKHFNYAFHALKQVAELTDSPEAYKLLEKLLSTPHKSETLIFLRDLANKGKPLAIEQLSAALKHPDRTVRLVALYQLSQIEAKTLQMTPLPKQREILEENVIALVKSELKQAGFSSNLVGSYALDGDTLGLGMTIIGRSGGPRAKTFLTSLQSAFQMLEQAETKDQRSAPKEFELAGVKIPIKEFPVRSTGTYLYRLNFLLKNMENQTSPLNSVAALR